MVTRDVNHPCILFWDNGNEGGFNPTLDALFSEFDPQRRRVLHPWTPFNGVNTSHYLAYDLAAIACTGVPTYYRDGKELADTNDPAKYIYMPTECMHGLFDGGAGAGLEDYWTLMQQSKFLGGAFIWALVDEGLKRPDTGTIDTAGNQAPDGIVGPYREREGSFHTIKELWSPIQVTRNTNGQLMVENRYNFTDANQCRFTWQLRQFPGPFETHTTVRVIGEGVLSAPSIPPGGRGAIPMDLPANWKEADALALRVSDPNGRELWTWVWPLPRLDTLPGMVNVSSRQVRIAEETADCITAKIGDLTASISKQTGLLIGVKRGAQKFSLTNGPRPVVGSSKVTRLEKATEGGDVIVTATYEGELRKVVWRVRSDGWVQCDYAYTATGPQPVSGVAFDYPESLVKRKRWLGNGPFRVWKNRLRGGQLGVWEDHYNDTITGWRDWVYPEFKGCFAGRALDAVGNNRRPDHRCSRTQRCVCSGSDARSAADEPGGEDGGAASASRAGVSSCHPAHWQQVQGRGHQRPSGPANCCSGRVSGFGPVLLWHTAVGAASRFSSRPLRLRENCPAEVEGR